MNSDLYGVGIPAGKDAFINGHYRRFIRMEELVLELQGLGFTIEDAIEMDGVAVYKDDNPVVVRVVARKRLSKENAI